MMSRLRNAAGPGAFAAAAVTVAFVLGGCESLLGPDEDDSIEYVVERFEVVTREVDGLSYPIASLTTELALVNRGADTLRLEYGACSVDLQGAATEPGTVRAGWSSEERMNWPSGGRYACPLYAASSRVAPGDTLRVPELTYRIPLAEILADSLPAGRFAFEATVALGHDPRRVDLGEVLLPVSRHPVPEASVMRDGFRYDVRVEAEADDHRVTLTIGHTGITSRALERDISGSCPVKLLAFRQEAALTTIPLPEPAWSWPGDCPAGEETVSLAAGEARTVSATLPAAALAAASASGRYHLLGVIEVDGRPLRVIVGPLELDR